MNRMPSRALRALLVGAFASLVPAAPALAVDFAATPIATLTNLPDATVVGDFDANGRVDLAVASSSDGINPLTVHRRTPGGSYEPQPIDTGGKTIDELVAADLDGDGDVDLASADRWDGTMIVHVSNRDGTF